MNSNVNLFFSSCSQVVFKLSTMLDEVYLILKQKSRLCFKVRFKGFLDYESSNIKLVYEAERIE